ncbi:MAG: von Willebrand factor type A domain-containing protein [Sulfuricurvum sp.]|jgi:Ca-activated chloride channel family protein
MKKAKSIAMAAIAALTLFAGCGNPQPEVAVSNNQVVKSHPSYMAASYNLVAKSPSYMSEKTKSFHLMSAPSPVTSYMQASPSSYTTEVVRVNTERYSHTEENSFKTVSASPLSTLSIDVDTASYTNIVRMIDDEDRLPPKGAVRIEEMMNYFSYNYPQPEAKSSDPFTITAEVSKAPWNTKHQLLLVGLQAKNIAKEHLPSSNFVALVDVSGSMSSDLPLVKQSLKMLAKKLDKRDRLSIVNYATHIGVTLEPTSGDQYDAIEKAIDTLASYGGTNGQAGIEVAYEFARKTFLADGNNRVLMFTDGDFNVGRTSESEMVSIVEKERQSGIFLSIIGFGRGNVNDSTMEQMADHGNGNYSYVNDLLDAKKTFDTELTGTLYTLGKDVKFQLEFNPSVIGSYRLIGYENRVLNAEDFNDDTKDAGEIGVGHTVTALYELIPADLESNNTRKVDKLKYQKNAVKASNIEIATVKMRYKTPDGNTSKLMSVVVPNKEQMTDNLTFASAVAGYGMLLGDSKYKGEWKFEDVIKQAKASKGNDEEGYRAAFIRLVEKTELLKQSQK